MDPNEFTQSLAKIPDLLAIAKEQEPVFYYERQESLRQEYRKDGKPFLYSMPMRHLSLCQDCDFQSTDIAYSLEDPRSQKQIEFNEGTLHRIKEHGEPPSDELAEVLLNCLESLSSQLIVIYI